MKRLTKRINGGITENRDHDTPTNLFRNNTEHCMERLAAYEDTGLMPDEVAALKDLLNKAVNELRDYARKPCYHCKDWVNGRCVRPNKNCGGFWGWIWKGYSEKGGDKNG